jgi:hypothetical protein
MGGSSSATRRRAAVAEEEEENGKAGAREEAEDVVLLADGLVGHGGRAAAPLLAVGALACGDEVSRVFFARWALYNLIDRWASHVYQITQHTQATAAQIYSTISASQRLR